MVVVVVAVAVVVVVAQEVACAVAARAPSDQCCASLTILHHRLRLLNKNDVAPLFIRLCPLNVICIKGSSCSPALAYLPREVPGTISAGMVCPDPRESPGDLLGVPHQFAPAPVPSASSETHPLHGRGIPTVYSQEAMGGYPGQAPAQRSTAYKPLLSVC